MVSRGFQVFSPLLVLLFAYPAWGQLDSSSAVLLHPSSYTTTPQNLDSTRYKVRAPESRKVEATDSDEEPGMFIASPVPQAAKETSAKVSTSTPVKTDPPPPTQVKAAAAPTPAPAPTSAAPPDAQAPAPRNEHPPVTVQMRELILGGSDEDIDEAKRLIHPEDPRTNIVSISIAPAYFYNASNSNYSFHDYHADGPALGLGMNLWFTPFFGLQSTYLTSVSSAVRDGDNMVPFARQDLQAGFRFRRHFGYTRKSAQISWGIDYRDSSSKISSDATATVGGRTTGLSVGLEGVIPTSVNYAHLFEVSIFPYAHHSEDNTSINIQSGGSCESNGVALSLGGQWTLDRRNQVYWKSQYTVERNLFDGTASTVDPKTGTTPSGVGVTNSMVVFYFGFKWGS